MKRDQFLKTIAVFAGGLTVVSCSPDLLDELVVAEENPEDLTIEEAEKWFNDVYLPQSSKLLRVVDDGKSHRRMAAWGRAQKPKNAQDEEYGWVWVPLDYEGSGRPGVILYDEDTSYRLELKNYFIQPIIEGLIVVKVGMENKAFLAQIAYDPFALAANKYILEKANFTGTLLRADWNDNLIDGTVFNKGEIVKGFANPANAILEPANAALENARTSDCYYYSVQYQTWEVGSDGIFTVVSHTSWATVCNDSGGWGSGGGTGTGGGYTVTNGGTGGAYYDPLVGSGGGWVYPSNLHNSFNINNAIATNGPDRAKMNENLTNALYAVGLGVTVAGWSYDKGIALAHSVGYPVNKFFPLAQSVSRSFGVVGFMVSGYQLYAGVTDNGWQWDEDGWNLAMTTLAIPGALALSVGAPWLVVMTGGVSLGIAIATAP